MLNFTKENLLFAMYTPAPFILQPLNTRISLAMMLPDRLGILTGMTTIAEMMRVFHMLAHLPARLHDARGSHQRQTDALE